MRQRPHSHPCRTCQQAVPCSGEWERNHDGFPEAICPMVHLDSGRTVYPLCEDCEGRVDREGEARARA